MRSRRIGHWLALTGFLVAAGMGAGPEGPKLAVESYKLENGLKVVLHRDPSVPRVTVAVAYHVGSKNERAGRTGFAHFFEHMMFRGTKNVPNYDIPLQETGAQSNAFTSEDMTVYFETVASHYLERALYLEAERLAFLPTALDQAKFDTEREVVKNERRQSYENVPYGLAEEAILAKLFPEGHPYSWSVIGSMRDLDRSSLADLRRFFGEFYHPANATLCLSGDFDPDQAKALIAKYFNPLKPGPVPAKVVAPESPPVSARMEQADRVSLPRVYWSWPTVADDHPDTPALDLLAAVLSDGEASRLHRALVLDTGLATEVDASSDTKEIAGLFRIEATAAEGKSIEDVEKALRVQVEKARSAAPGDAEMARAQAKFESSSFQRLTSQMGRAIALAVGAAQKDNAEYYREDFLRHAAVKPADVLRVAKKFLTPETLVLVVRPAQPNEAEAKAVQVGPKASKDAEAPIAERAPAPGPDWSKMPGPGTDRPLSTPKFVRKTLSNGLEVRAAKWTTLPLIGARLILPGGTADDPAGKAGLATLTSTLMDKGTANKTAVELAEAFDALGASVGTMAGLDDTIVSVGVIARNFGPAMTLVGEMLAKPRFDAKDVDRERQLQLTGLVQGPDSPQWIARRAFRALLYGKDHPYGSPSEGTTEGVKSLKVDDVRAFHKAHVRPKGATLIVVGDAEPEAVFAQLETALKGWTGEGAPRPEVAGSRARREPGQTTIYLIDKPGAVQSVLAVGRIWGDRKDPKHLATLLGNRVLGGDFLSRINQNLRERNGYSYGAGSMFSYRRAGSVWQISTNVRGDATAPALREILAEMDALAEKNPPTDEEVEVARDAEARSFPDDFGDPTRITSALAELAIHGLPDDELATYLDRLAAVPLDAIREEMARVVEPGARTILVVGDRKTVETKLKELKLGPVKVLDHDGHPVPDSSR
jgi:zinc protease